MNREFIHLAVIELNGADKLRRREQREAAVAQSLICGQSRVLRKPARDRRRMDGMAVAGGQPTARLFERVAAVIGRERIQNFMERIDFLADGAGTRRENPAA